MEDTNQTPYASRESHGSGGAYDALETLITAAGFDAGDLQVALSAIQQAKETKKSLPKEGENRFFLDKTLVYEDVDAFIFQRADIKSGRWYFRIYDTTTKKPIVRSLRTSDKIQGLATARLMYMDIKGKISRGERIKSITTDELIKIRRQRLEQIVTTVPHKGIVPETYRVKCYYLSVWSKYIKELGYANRTIDKIPADSTRNFGIWFMNQDKQTCLGTKSRSPEQINNVISEVWATYKQIAIRDHYINRDKMPQIDKVKEQKDEMYKNEVLTEEEYEQLWKYLEYQYTRDKKVKPSELANRKVFKDFIGILYNTGCRPKELFGLKLKEITTNPAWDQKTQDTNVVLFIRADNSKTGKARRVVAPIKKRINRIIAEYKKMGAQHQPDDFIFMNPNNDDRKAFVRQTYFMRLKRILIKSGLQEKFDKEGKSINLYSGRHTYACWRLRYGDVPIHLLAKQMGTSVAKIESVYGHIETENKVDIITKSQGTIKRAGIVLEKPLIIEDNDLYGV